ncbi:MAG: cytochrome P450 [Solirubrobacteraceae bacterium]
MTGALDPFFLEDPSKLDEPFSDLAWLREHRPVYHHEPLDQWFVFRYDDVRSLFADVRLSANRMSGFTDAVPAPVRDEVRRLVPLFETWLMMRDGAEHRRLRTRLHTGFNASAIEALHAPIERAANDLLERRQAYRSLDISGDYGLLLPAYVLADFIGVPREDRDRVVGWSLDFVDFFNEIPITEQSTRRMVATAQDMMSYMRPLLAERRREPREDFLGSMARLAASGDEGDEITEDEIVGNTMLLLLAGHLPVRNLIGNAVWLLLSDPGQAAAVRRDPSQLRAAVEETLRFEPPVTLIPRIALQDIELRGETIPAGAIVQLSLAAANRDPDKFDRPDSFDLTRDPRGVLSFGHGPHGCLGARLAREQSLVALSILFARLDDLRLDENAEIRWYRNAANRGPDELHLTFGAIAA